MNRQKVYAALSAVRLIDGKLIHYENPRTLRPCYCGVGALLHGANIPDDDLWALQDVTITHVMSAPEIVEEVIVRYGDRLVIEYEFRNPNHAYAALEVLMDMVDCQDVTDPEMLVDKMERT